MWEKEKMLVTTIFSFYYILSRINSAIWASFDLLSGNAFSLDLAKILLFGKDFCF